MRKKILTIIMMCLSCQVYALEPELWDVCLRYKFQDATDAWKVDRDKNGKAFIYDWKLGGTIPTEAELAAVKTQAVEWWTEKQKAQKADFDNWKVEELKALAKVLLDEINVIRQKQGLEPRTADQLKAAIKAKL